MNERRDDKLTETDETFVRQSAELFNDSVAGLDAATRSQLNRGRQQALAAARPGQLARWQTWVPVGAAAAVTAVALVTFTGQEAPGPLTTPSVASDLEILMDGEELEMLEDLEFYSWLDLESEAGDGHVG